MAEVGAWAMPCTVIPNSAFPERASREERTVEGPRIRARTRDCAPVTITFPEWDGDQVLDFDIGRDSNDRGRRAKAHRGRSPRRVARIAHRPCNVLPA